MDLADTQDEYHEALNKLHITIMRALNVNPSIHLEVFIHKVDGLTSDYQQGTSSQYVTDSRYKTGYTATDR